MIGALRTGSVVLGAVGVRLLVGAPIPVAGVTGDAMLLISVAAGISSGPTRGAVVGFAAGIVLDIGAHSGCYTIAAARANPAADVLSSNPMRPTTRG